MRTGTAAASHFCAAPAPPRKIGDELPCFFFAKCRVVCGGPKHLVVPRHFGFLFVVHFTWFFRAHVTRVQFDKPFVLAVGAGHVCEGAVFRRCRCLVRCRGGRLVNHRRVQRRAFL